MFFSILTMSDRKLKILIDSMTQEDKDRALQIWIDAAPEISRIIGSFGVTVNQACKALGEKYNDKENIG